MICSACESARVARIRSVRAQQLFRCHSCGHLFFECLPEQSLRSLYDEHYTGFRHDAVFARRIRELIASVLVPAVQPPAKVLDVGCGNGEFLVAAREAGYQAFGVDFFDDATKACAARGLDARCADFLTHDFRDIAPFDIITFWDVLEHLDNPSHFLARTHELLSAQGLLVAKVPRVSRRSVFLSGAVPRLAGALISLPGHVQMFRPTTLTQMAQRAGFAHSQVVALGGIRGHGTPPVSVAGRTKRELVRALHRANGDGNLLLTARV